MHLEAKMDFWIKENLNILLVGKHGVGKTTVVKEAFERNNLKWMYFSAATMDPWVDFIGVPKEKTEGGITYLELVRPKCFQTDEVEALFFDEFNRSHKKVRNAVMELIQFKSINGKKFKNLKVIWAAINPDDEEEEIKYDVEKLDPAQVDRFHIKIDIPYKPDYSYFKGKYGEVMAEASINWWKQLDKPTQNLISPRRLDYALDIFSRKGDLRDVLPSKCNIGKLIKDISFGSVEKRMKDIFIGKDKTQAKEFMSDENNFEESNELLRKNKNWIEFFVPYMSEEHLAVALSSKLASSSSNPFLDFVLKEIESFEGVLRSLIAAGTIKHKKSIFQISGALERLKNDRSIKEHGYNINAPVVQDKKTKYNELVKVVDSLANLSLENTIERVGVFSQIVEFIVPGLSISDAHAILATVNTIIGRSHNTTLQNNPYQDNLILVVNTCFKAILKAEESKGKEELTKYAYVFEHCRPIPNFMFYSAETKPTVFDAKDKDLFNKETLCAYEDLVSSIVSKTNNVVLPKPKGWLDVMSAEKRNNFFKKYKSYFTNKVITSVNVQESPNSLSKQYTITTKNTSTKKEEDLVVDDLDLLTDVPTDETAETETINDETEFKW